nr:MAG TPA: hypothetical protein [Caudoviricetes sp.]
MCRKCERYLLLTTRNKAPIVGINKVAPLQRVAGR